MRAALPSLKRKAATSQEHNQSYRTARATDGVGKVVQRDPLTEAPEDSRRSTANPGSAIRLSPPRQGAPNVRQAAFLNPAGSASRNRQAHQCGEGPGSSDQPRPLPSPSAQRPLAAGAGSIGTVLMIAPIPIRRPTRAHAETLAFASPTQSARTPGRIATGSTCPWCTGDRDKHGPPDMTSANPAARLPEPAPRHPR